MKRFFSLSTLKKMSLTRLKKLAKNRNTIPLIIQGHDSRHKEHIALSILQQQMNNDRPRLRELHRSNLATEIKYNKRTKIIMDLEDNYV